VKKTKLNATAWVMPVEDGLFSIAMHVFQGKSDSWVHLSDFQIGSTARYGNAAEAKKALCRIAGLIGAKIDRWALPADFEKTWKRKAKTKKGARR
jgi:hypothetical protein